MQKLIPILLLLLANTSLVECKTRLLRLQKKSSKTLLKKEKRSQLPKDQEKSKKEGQRIGSYIAVVVFFIAAYVIVDKGAANAAFFFAKDIKPKVLENYNPYKVSNPYEVFPIDWDKSTLAPEAIEDFKKDKKHITYKNVKHIWPAYVTAKLFRKKIYSDNKLIPLFYKSSSKLSTEEFLKEMKQSLEEPYYFHATKKIDNALNILSDEEISITGFDHPGAFVAAKNPASGFGRFIFSFKRDIEFFTLPLSYSSEWVGFWKPIPLKEYLHEIFINTKYPGNQMSDQDFDKYKGRLQKKLKEKGYNESIKVSKLSSLKERRQKAYQKRNLNGNVIPVWFDLKQRFTLQRNKNNELFVQDKRRYRELYSEKKLNIAGHQR